MNKFFLLAIIATLACSSHQAALTYDGQAEIVKHDSQTSPDGSYKLDYATSNGISVQEQGFGGQHSTGGFAYYSPEGELIQLSFLSDENGFQPQGNHLPTPPPIPEQILKSLEYNRLHPYDEKAEQQLQKQQYNPQKQQFQHFAASSNEVNNFHGPAQQRRHF
ncbi:pupal cuticle protein Edg-78E-like [Eurosta solidaginis]|uniref:pupal cuticle protein Edg-78E-like n=1 Tax=Eurosta solidaginis TaxID=178769 RepID=UPI003531748E